METDYTSVIKGLITREIIDSLTIIDTGDSGVSDFNRSGATDVVREILEQFEGFMRLRAFDEKSIRLILNDLLLAVIAESNPDPREE